MKDENEVGERSFKNNACGKIQIYIWNLQRISKITSQI